MLEAPVRFEVSDVTPRGEDSCVTPVKGVDADSMVEAFMRTFRRDLPRVSPSPDAPTMSWRIAAVCLVIVRLR